MKVAKISKKLIKPHTPTPQNLKKYYVSFLDQTVASAKFSVVLFYQSKPEIQMQLEDSLAKILVEFYPLAGRYMKNDYMIDCSDQGAMFVEAEALDVDLTIDNIVKTMEIQKLNDLFPDQDFVADAPNPLLAIQVTHFPSGGLAIAISVSHVVFDASSLGTFIAAWSNVTNPNRTISITPSFNLPSLLPHKDCDFDDNVALLSEGGEKNIVTRRLFFDKVALTRLRSKLDPNHTGRTISRVLVVCAVIAETLIRLDKAKHGKRRDFLIIQTINMRGRTTTHQPKHVCGNLVMPSFTRGVPASSEEDMMQKLVDLMGDAIKKSIDDHAELLSPNGVGIGIVINTGENYMKEISIPETNLIIFSDWSKFGFYEADFGWGKPVWVSMKTAPVANMATLMTNKEGDGIEAWVYLNQDDMDYFEKEEEIKLFLG